MPGPGKGVSSRGEGAWSRGTWFRGSGPGGVAGLGVGVPGPGGWLPGWEVWSRGVCVETPPPTATAAGVLLECILVLNKIGCLLIYFRVFSTAVVYSFNLLIS